MRSSDVHGLGLTHPTRDRTVRRKPRTVVTLFNNFHIQFRPTDRHTIAVLLNHCNSTVIFAIILCFLLWTIATVSCSNVVNCFHVYLEKRPQGSSALLVFCQQLGEMSLFWCVWNKQKTFFCIVLDARTEHDRFFINHMYVLALRKLLTVIMSAVILLTKMLENWTVNPTLWCDAMF